VAAAGRAGGSEPGRSETIWEIELDAVSAVGGDGPPLMVGGAFVAAESDAVEDEAVGRDGGSRGAAQSRPVLRGEGVFGGCRLGEGWERCENEDAGEALEEDGLLPHRYFSREVDATGFILLCWVGGIALSLQLSVRLPTARFLLSHIPASSTATIVFR
jgi:hypothetical protein